MCYHKPSRIGEYLRARPEGSEDAPAPVDEGVPAPGQQAYLGLAILERAGLGVCEPCHQPSRGIHVTPGTMETVPAPFAPAHRRQAFVEIARRVIQGVDREAAGAIDVSRSERPFAFDVNHREAFGES